MNMERFALLLDNLFKDPEFHEFNIHQINKIAQRILRAEEKAYSEGLRDGVIEYRKAASRGEGVV